MSFTLIINKIQYLVNRTRERLWVRPVGTCLLSIASILFANSLSDVPLPFTLPVVTRESVETLLSVLTGGMLAIATFAVGAMVSAYGSASSTATPRSFSVVVSDDISQNALSVFIGAFIFSVVGLASLKNNLLEPDGLTVLFALTLLVFAIVVFSFVRWVDRIARLGRLGTTIENVEKVCLQSINKSNRHPHMQGCPVSESKGEHRTLIYSEGIGHIQRIDVEELQKVAESHQGKIRVLTLPGCFVGLDRAVGCFIHEGTSEKEIDSARILKAFEVGRNRVFDGDPQFGLIVLSEIASRALSPAVNDPGTALDVLGSLHRLVQAFAKEPEDIKDTKIEFDRVEVPEIPFSDVMTDAFASISRDGATNVEVVMRLQKTLGSLSRLGNASLQKEAFFHSETSLARSENDMTFPPDVQKVREVVKDQFRNP